VNQKHRDRADYLIYHIDRLIEQYDTIIKYTNDNDVDTIVEYLNCHVEWLVGGDV
jgi:hypothetical protein